MKNFDLDTPIIDFGGGNGMPQQNWTLRNAYEGVQIFGGIGSGKSSGSGKLLAIKYLRSGFGGLVLTVKQDEKDTWVQYCKAAGRSNDLIIIEPNGKYGFDFMGYLCAKHKGDHLAVSISEALKTVINAGEDAQASKSDDRFFDNALDMLVLHTIDLCLLAYGTVNLQMMYNIVTSAPKEKEVVDSDKIKESAFGKAFTRVNQRVKNLINNWWSGLDKAKQDALQHPNVYTDALESAVPEARVFRLVDQFFIESYKNLTSRTRSIVEFSFSGFLTKLLRNPAYSLFCKSGGHQIKPEDSTDGKIILVNMPVKVFNKVGRDCQILFKYLWQVEMERRDLHNNRPVFLYADEAQHFLHQHDAVFQATARSSSVATCYITQCISNYEAAMGGDDAKHRVNSFLGTLATKIFHANADIDSNKYGSELIGDRPFLESSASVTTGKEPSRTDGLNYKIDREIRPEQFVSLKTGGAKNNHMTSAYIHVQGTPLFDGENYKLTQFNQNIL